MRLFYLLLLPLMALGAACTDSGPSEPDVHTACYEASSLHALPGDYYDACVACGGPQGVRVDPEGDCIGREWPPAGYRVLKSDGGLACGLEWEEGYWCSTTCVGGCVDECSTPNTDNWWCPEECSDEDSHGECVAACEQSCE